MDTPIADYFEAINQVILVKVIGAKNTIGYSPKQVDKQGCVHFKYIVKECENCGGIVDQDAVVSVTGQELSTGHTPMVGEIIQNHFESCRNCKEWQVS